MCLSTKELQQLDILPNLIVDNSWFLVDSKLFECSCISFVIEGKTLSKYAGKLGCSATEHFVYCIMIQNQCI